MTTETWSVLITPEYLSLTHEGRLRLNLPLTEDLFHTAVVFAQLIERRYPGRVQYPTWRDIGCSDACAEWHTVEDGCELGGSDDAMTWVAPTEPEPQHPKPCYDMSCTHESHGLPKAEPQRCEEHDLPSPHAAGWHNMSFYRACGPAAVLPVPEAGK